MAEHPLTRKRRIAHLELGKRIVAYGQAKAMLERGDANDEFLSRKRDECNQAIHFLVEAAQEEGGAS